jgi:hypothetical protein
MDDRKCHTLGPYRHTHQIEDGGNHLLHPIGVWCSSRRSKDGGYSWHRVCECPYFWKPVLALGLFIPSANASWLGEQINERGEINSGHHAAGHNNRNKETLQRTCDVLKGKEEVWEAETAAEKRVFTGPTPTTSVRPDKLSPRSPSSYPIIVP